MEKMNEIKEQRETEWQYVKLKNIAEINDYPQLKEGDVANYIPMKVVNPGERYIRSNVKRKYTGSGSRFYNEDILFAKITPCLENGKIGQYKSNDSNIGWGSTEFFVLRPKHKKVNQDYLYYLCSTNIVRGPAEKSMKGASGRQRVDRKVFENIEIPLPPKKQQKQISSVLSDFDDLIENNKRRIEILEEMAETIYREWFVNFNFPGSEDVEMKDSELGLIPETFEVCEFQEELEIQNGYAFKSETYSEKGMPIIRTKDYSSTKFVDREEDVRVPLKLAKEKRKYRSEELDFLLIMVGASIGNYGIVMKKDLPALQNQNMWAIRPKEGSYFSKYFVIHHMPGLVQRQKNFARGAAREYFRKGDFTSANITKPPKELVKLFDREVVSIVRLINNLLQRNETLRQIRDLLLPRLISGEIKTV